MSDLKFNMSDNEYFLSKFKGITEAKAKLILLNFGSKTINIINNNPDKLENIKGIGKRIIVDIKNNRQNIMKDWYNDKLVIFNYLRKLEISEFNCNKIYYGYRKKRNDNIKKYKGYGENTINAINKNPYMLIRYIGFKKTDEFALNILKIAYDNPNRILACCFKTLKNAKDIGHTLLPVEIFLNNLQKDTLKLKINDDVFKKINELLHNNKKISKTILTCNNLKKQAIGKYKYLEIENDIALKLTDIMKNKNYKKITDITDEYIYEIENIINEENKINENGNICKLDKYQFHTIKSVIYDRISIITGGPGTGKTTITRFIVNIFKKNKFKILCLAPTGKSSSRMKIKIGNITDNNLDEDLSDNNEENTLENNKQIIDNILSESESELEFYEESFEDDGDDDDCDGYLKKNKKKKFNFNSNKKNSVYFQRDFVISTIHKALMENINNFDVIIIDECSMINNEILHYLLKKVNAKVKIIFIGDKNQLPPIGLGNPFNCFNILDDKYINKYILKSVHRQNENSGILKNAYLINDNNIPIINTYDDWVLLNTSNDKIIDEVIDIIHSNLKTYNIMDIQILIPTNKGQNGTYNINKIIQKNINTNDCKFIFYKNKKYIIGDKVIHIKNNYTKMIMNGYVGLIVDIENNKIIVKFEENKKLIEYLIDSDELDELDLAYAISVHKSQGSDYSVVILIMSMEHCYMLKKRLFYTAVTRPKNKIYIIGSYDAIKFSLKNTDDFIKYTKLNDYIVEFY
jgi:exodeoxyribonuclease V alpha subunit